MVVVEFKQNKHFLETLIMSGNENDHVTMLKDKMKLKDLGEGAVFEIDTLNFDDAVENAKRKEKEFYSEKEFEDNLKHLSVSVLDEENMTELQGTPGSTSFASIALRMTDLMYEGQSTEGKVKKLILRPGEGELVPETALIHVHYSAYYEYSDEPFDSTYLRGQTFKLIPKSGDCIPGLLVGILSMKKREIAQILIDPDLGYGKMGVPPRIPPNAVLLYQVEIVKFIDGVEGQPPGFSHGNKEEEVNVMKKANAKYLEGNDHYKKRNIADAIVKYRKALSLIENERQGNEDDEEKRTHLMLTLFTNLALCYIKKENFDRATKMSQRALEIKPNHCKAQFYLGKSLLLSNEDLNAAKKELLKAQKLEPTNLDINKEIVKLEKKMAKYKLDEKQMSKRMFPETNDNAEAESENVSIQSKWTTYLTTFLNDETDTSLSLPIAITTEELNAIETEALKLGLTLHKGLEKITIKKVK